MAGSSRKARANVDDGQSVTSRRSNRQRNKVNGTGATSYGTNAPEAVASQTAFQATQSHAASNLGVVLRRAGPLASAPYEELDEFDEDELDRINNPQINDTQDALDSQLGGSVQDTPTRTPGNTTPLHREGLIAKLRRTSANWAFGRNRRDGNITYTVNNEQDTSRTFGQVRGPRSAWEHFMIYLSEMLRYYASKIFVLAVILLLAFPTYRFVAPYVKPALQHVSQSMPFRHNISVVTNECPQDGQWDKRLDALKSSFDRRFDQVWGEVHREPAKPKIDFFAPSNDAIVVSKLTSPTKKRKVTGIKRLFKKEVEFKKNPSIVGPFKDPKKMWCAPSDRGKAQITVNMAVTMIPQELVIQQNLAYSEALDADTYPKEIELWVDIKDDEKRANILRQTIRRYPVIMKKTVSQEGRYLAKAQTLPDTFVPIGMWTYDVRSNLARQSFTIHEIHNFSNITTTTASVRVNSNWGNTEATCLHQVSLYGEQAHGRKVYNDPTVGEVDGGVTVIKSWGPSGENY